MSERMCNFIKLIIMMSSIACLANGSVLLIRAGILLYSSLFPVVSKFSAKEYWACLLVGGLVFAVGLMGIDDMLRMQVVLDEETDDEE